VGQHQTLSLETVLRDHPRTVGVDAEYAPSAKRSAVLELIEKVVSFVRPCVRVVVSDFADLSLVIEGLHSGLLTGLCIVRSRRTSCAPRCVCRSLERNSQLTAHTRKQPNSKRAKAPKDPLTFSTFRNWTYIVNCEVVTCEILHSGGAAGRTQRVYSSPCPSRRRRIAALSPEERLAAQVIGSMLSTRNGRRIFFS